MIEKLIRSALDQRFFTIIAGIALIVVGLAAAFQLKIEAYPDISDTAVQIITVVPGRATEEVEQQITVPIERALNSTPGLISRRSRTIFGLSVVDLTFEYGTNDYFARQVVLEKLRDAELPDGVTPTLGPLATPIGELYRYSLEGGGLNPQQLRELQDWVIAPRLLQSPGIADVVPFGGLVKQYQIQISPLGLEKYKISLRDLADAVSQSNQNAGGALLDNKQQSLAVRGVGMLKTTSDIENSVVAENGGVPIFVKDLGHVGIGSAPPTGAFGLSKNSGGVEGIVLMRRGENPTDVLKRVHEAVNELNSTRLPRGVEMKPIYDRTDLVNNTLETVSKTLLEGLVVVVMVLLLFLGSFKAALLTALTIPLSLLFAFVCMNLTGIPANLLSLGALDFGIIVDGSLIMVENILHKLEEGHQDHQEEVFASIKNAALEVANPLFFSLLIIIAAYIPLFTLERVERRLFTPMAFTVCFALLGAMILALTLIPVLATFLFRKGAHAWHNPLLGWMSSAYEKILMRSLKAPWIAVGVSFVIVAAAFAISTTLGSEFLPSLDEGTIWVRTNLPPGTSLEKSDQVAARIRLLLEQFPEVNVVGSQAGRNDAGTDPYGPNRTEYLVTLKPYKTWPEGRTKALLVNDIATLLQDNVPGANFSITQPIIDNVTEAVTGSAADLAVIITGPDLKILRDLANQTLAAIRTVSGSADTGVEQEGEQPQLMIRLQRENMARYGIRVRDVQDQIELAIGGRTVSAIFEGERRFDLSVRFAPEARVDATAIAGMLVPARNGARVPLSQLAEIEVRNGQSIIARRENQRQIAVRTNIRGRDQGGFAADAQKVFAQKIRLPEGYRVEWGGQFENMERARKRLSIVLPLTIAIIFVLLFFAFGSSRDAGLVMLNVPFSLVGGILFLWIRGINLSVSAAVGFISLFGVAVMSGVLVVSEINRRWPNVDDSLEEAVVNGALKQMRPVLLMILVALLGMVPAARATGIGSDVQRPLATVVVGGLLSTFFLTLLALPSLYYVVARRKKSATI
ncbi:efflux RND transporter permease subunit [Bryobacter aggregatus]|uniref:efflux RND transporter permease subunit n=1 Tax=Bryobacter aggregatus TaxID=360054 RepID=UPI0004E1A48C|nr:CusA/CzcA family heavy metal efflux RND transporter [Bryobacter aggregatus]